VIGHGEQQGCGRDVKRPGLWQKLPVQRVAARSPPKYRRVEKAVVVLRHFTIALREQARLIPLQDRLGVIVLHF
jgi:hypothetical protein